MKKTLAFILAAVLCITAAACSKKTEGAEDDSPGSAAGSIEEQAAGDGQNPRDTRPESTVPLTEDLLDGTWVDDEGFVCRIDSQEHIFTDCYGVRYDLISVDDDSITLGGLTSDEFYYEPSPIPFGGSVTFDALFGDDTLYILDRNAVRLDSEEGGVIADRIRDSLAGHSFAAGGYLTSIDFNDDMTLMGGSAGLVGEIGITFDGAQVVTDNGNSFFVRLIDDKVFFVIEGTLSMMSSGHADASGRWVLYDSGSKEMRILDFTDEEGGFFSEDPLTGSREGIGYDRPRISNPSTNMIIELDGAEYYGSLSLPGVYVNVDNENGPFVYLFDTGSPCAAAVVQRQITINDDEGSLSQKDIPIADGFISINVLEDVWPGDVVNEYRYENDNILDQKYGVDIDLESGVYLVGIDRDFDGEMTISFECGNEITEDTSICCCNDLYSSEIERLDTTFENGYATASISGNGLYFFGDVRIASVVTTENFFDVDPATTAWAYTEATDDVLERIDLEYIRRSMNGVFVVNTPEELASLTYFINVYPRVYEDNLFVWVDQTCDIDLTGLQWVPLGLDNDPDGNQRSFCGIYCGNGHVIRGLHIENENDNIPNGFFGNIYFSTVIGVNLEDAYITGWRSGLMCYDTSTTSYIDCHVSGILPDAIHDDDALFPNQSDYGNNGYNNCSYSVTNYEGTLYEGSLTENYPNMGGYNELERHFDPEGDGVYDYSEDYFFDEPSYLEFPEGIDETTDTDGDGIPDYIEVTGIHGPNGEIWFTDPEDPDTDGDGLTDGEECGFV